MLFNVGIVGSVSVSVEQIENFFFGQDFTFLMENFKVIFFDIIINTLELFVNNYN